MRFFPPFLFNLTWLIDTFLIKLFGKEEDSGDLHDGIGSLMIIGSLVAGSIALVLLPFVFSEAFVIWWKALCFLLLGWIAYGLAAWPYFKALQIEQIENITPVYQIIPLITYLLGVIFLKEIISPWILLAIIGVILVTSLFYVDFLNFRFNKKAFFLCALSAGFYAVSYVFFKVGGLSEWSFMVALFWEHIWVLLVGIYFFLSKRTRNSTIAFFRESGRKFSFLNLFNELIFIAGVAINNYLGFSHYVVYVGIISSGIQPILAFPMKYIANLIKPERYDRKYTKTQLLTKVILLALLFVGVGYISLQILNQ